MPRRRAGALPTGAQSTSGSSDPDIRLTFTISAASLVVGLGAPRAITIQGIGAPTLVALPALAMWLGQKLREGIEPSLFRRLLLIGLALLAPR